MKNAASRKGLWALSAALVAGGALWLGSQSHDADSPAAQIDIAAGAGSAASSADAPAAAGPATGSSGAVDTRSPWHPARAWPGSYHLAVTTKIVRSPAAGASGSVTLDATLTLNRPTVGAQGTAWFFGEVHDVVVRGDGPLAGYFTGPAGAGQDEARSFAFQIDNDGEIIERRFAPNMPEALGNTLATLSAALTPDEAPDSRGFVTLGAAEHAERTWRRGDAEHAPDGPRGSGQATLLRDARGLASVDYDYRLAADLTLDVSAPMHHEVQTTMQLVRQGEAPAVGPRVALEALLPEGHVDTHKGVGIRPPSNRSVAEVVAAASDAFTARDQTLRGQLGDELISIVEAHPAGLADVIARLHAPGLDGDPLRTLVTALANARSPSAIAAMVQLLDDPQVPNISRHSLVSVVTFLPRPAPELIARVAMMLDDRADPQRAAAAHALAAQAKQQDARDPELAATLRAEIMAHATASLAGLGLDDAELWLSALGNLGGPEAWPLVKDYLVHKDKQMRLLAIEALRFVPLPAARLALAKAMRLDPEHANRRRAVEMALYHPQATLQDSVLRALREDPDASVRLGAGHVVAVWGVTSPVLYTELAAAADRERQPEVRRALLDLQPVAVDAQVTP